MPVKSLTLNLLANVRLLFEVNTYSLHLQGGQAIAVNRKRGNAVASPATAKQRRGNASNLLVNSPINRLDSI